MADQRRMRAVPVEPRAAVEGLLQARQCLGGQLGDPCHPVDHPLHLGRQADDLPPVRGDLADLITILVLRRHRWLQAGLPPVAGLFKQQQRAGELQGERLPLRRLQMGVVAEQLEGCQRRLVVVIAPAPLAHQDLRVQFVQQYLRQIFHAPVIQEATGGPAPFGTDLLQARLQLAGMGAELPHQALLHRRLAGGRLQHLQPTLPGGGPMNQPKERQLGRHRRQIGDQIEAEAVQ
ncbi:hypothetical protein D3C87_1453780 [compost metagenome]